MRLWTVLKDEVVLVILGVLGLVGVGVALATCDKHEADKLPPPPPFVKAHGSLEVSEDHERGVVCYYAEHGTSGALACVRVYFPLDGGGP